MTNQQRIVEIAREVNATLDHDESADEWWHTYRVWTMARRLAAAEGADTLITELAALLHDSTDCEDGTGKTPITLARAADMLERHGVSADSIDRVIHIIRDDRRAEHGASSISTTLEGRIVQDADRLDAIGAVGLAQALSFGGAAGRPLYNPETNSLPFLSSRQYRATRTPTINHLCEQHRTFRAMMHTRAGQQIAQERSRFMEAYLNRLFGEWEAEL